MNRFQRISQEILAEQRKQQLGLDPEADIPPETLRSLWHKRRIQRIRDRMSEANGGAAKRSRLSS